MRRHLARELHDRVATDLLNLIMDIEGYKLDQAGRALALSELSSIQHVARNTLRTLREILYEVRGDEPASMSLAQRLSEILIPDFEGRAGISVRLEVSEAWPAAMRMQASRGFYRIIEEALNNVRLHSEARQVVIRAGVLGDAAVIEVEDDGVGVGSEGPQGLGTLGMAERAELLGGTLTIARQPGSGTLVRAQVPLQSLI